MKRHSTLAAALAALLLAAGSGRGQLLVKPQGYLHVLGDSTLHKWSCASDGAAMAFALADGAPADLRAAIAAAKVKGLEVRVPVASLKSGESGLDKNLRKAMNADKYPDVVYKLGAYELGKPTDRGVIPAKTTGELTISGQTKTVPMDVEFRLGPDGVSLRGVYSLKMSEYGIKPPSLMLGAIKVRDPVDIRFDLTLAANAGGAIGAAGDEPQKQK